MDDTYDCHVHYSVHDIAHIDLNAECVSKYRSYCCDVGRIDVELWVFGIVDTNGCYAETKKNVDVA